MTSRYYIRKWERGVWEELDVSWVLHKRTYVLIVTGYSQFGNCQGNKSAPFVGGGCERVVFSGERGKKVEMTERLQMEILRCVRRTKGIAAMTLSLGRHKESAARNDKGAGGRAVA
jgi:hypothetical protein